MEVDNLDPCDFMQEIYMDTPPDVDIVPQHANA